MYDSRRPGSDCHNQSSALSHVSDAGMCVKHAHRRSATACHPASPIWPRELAYMSICSMVHGMYGS